jgi:aryl-alcohol dehydrogenase-like predicted oxidoreductase
MPVISRFPRSNSSFRDRRDFLKTCGTAAGGVLLGNLAGCESAPPTPPAVERPSHLVRFGHTDLYVSRLCQGTAFRKVSRKADDPEGLSILRHCIDIGVNFFDSSEAYGWGGSETVLGKAMAGRRDQVVVCTKAAPVDGPESERLVFTRDVLFRKAEGSLKRLGTDYIDLYLLHSPDERTPSTDANSPPADVPTAEHMEQLADSLDELVKAGKIRYWGVSNHLARQVGELIELGKREDKSPIAGLEDYYNLVAADRADFMVQELFPLIRQGNLGLLAFSPLGEGRLAPGRDIPEGSPLQGPIEALDSVADQLGVTRPQVCVAWVLSHPEVTSVLAGAEKPEHVSDNFAGTRITLPEEALQRLNAASAAYTEAVTKAAKKG